MTALLFFDAIDAARAIWQALLVWIVVGAVAGTVLVLGTVATLRWVWRRAWRAPTAPLAAEQAPQAPNPLPALHKPSAPAWALTDKEAA